MGYTLIGCSILMLVAAVGDYYPTRQADEQRSVTPEEVAESDLIAQAGDMKVQIARWYDGKAAAFSIQFQGGDPSHLKIAIPVLNRYGRHPFVGTFLVDRESDSYKTHREEWEKAILEGGHEFGSDTAKATHVLSVGTDPAKADIYNMKMFEEKVDQIVADKGWASFSFHTIGEESGMGIGEKPFREMMYYLKMKRYRWNAWIGGASQIYKYQAERNAAKISAQVVDPFKVKIQVDCDTDPEIYDQPLTISVDFRMRWPHYNYDIQVLDKDGNPIPARRAFSPRDRLFIAVPPKSGTYYVHVEDPRRGQPDPPDESARSVHDATTGLSATISKWFHGKQAAVSFRFDDSYSSHILKAIPMLREYGFKGTFFINPGNSNYQRYKEAWAACAAQGDQELANHTMHHDGAHSDEEVEREVGEVSRHIWELFPGKSKLHSFNEGGGTVWTYSKRFREFMDKYHLFPAYGRPGLSMSNDRVADYRERLAQAIAEGEWFTGLYHQIDAPHMNEKNFRATLDITKQHEHKIWVAGMADVYKYEKERTWAQLVIENQKPGTVKLSVSCSTDPELYDQPLTIQLTLPGNWSAETLKVRDEKYNIIPTRAAMAEQEPVVCFDVPPIDGDYSINQ